jgi:hypothetical protein
LACKIQNRENNEFKLTENITSQIVCILQEEEGREDEGRPVRREWGALTLSKADWEHAAVAAGASRWRRTRSEPLAAGPRRRPG